MSDKEIGRFGAFTLFACEMPKGAVRIKVRQGSQLIATHTHPMLSEHELKKLAVALPKVIEIQRILAVVSEYYGVPERAIKSQNRTRTVIVPRHVVCYLAYTLTNYTYIEIGGVLGGRDHSSVLYAVRVIEEKLIGDESLRDVVAALKIMLKTE